MINNGWITAIFMTNYVQKYLVNNFFQKTRIMRWNYFTIDIHLPSLIDEQDEKKQRNNNGRKQLRQNAIDSRKN